MEPPTTSHPPRPLSRSTTRTFIPLNVSTRSMARLSSSSNLSNGSSIGGITKSIPSRSLASSKSTGGISSSISRPTLSSARKTNTTLKSSRGNRILSETARDNVDLRSDTGNVGMHMPKSPGVILGGKRKNVDHSEERIKKVRLESSFQSLNHTSNNKNVNHQTPRSGIKYPTTPHRSFIPTTPKRHTAFTPIRSALKTPTHKTPHTTNKWKTPLAHTPNRFYKTAPEDTSATDDALLLGDSPVPLKQAGDSMMPLLEKIKAEDDVKGNENIVVQEQDEKVDEKVEEGMTVEDVDDEEWMKEEPMEVISETSTSIPSAEVSVDCNQEKKVEVAYSESEKRENQEHTEETEEEEMTGKEEEIEPFNFTSPPFSDDDMEDQRSPSPKKITIIPTPPRPAQNGLAPPSSGFKIAPSPRKGLSSISRFGTPKKSDGAPSIGLLGMKRSTQGIQLSMLSEEKEPLVPELKKAVQIVEEDQEMEIVKGKEEIRGILPDPPTVEPSMPPPSRMPVRSTRFGLSSSTSYTKLSAAVEAPPTAKKPALNNLGSRRPISTPTMVSQSSSIRNLSAAASAPVPPKTTNTSRSSNEDQAVRRKPSYPSSLGSGPLAKPRERQISMPVPCHIIEFPHPPRPASSSDNFKLPGTPSNRSVSAPVPREKDRERLSLSMSSRGEGWMDTSKSLHGLSEALERLKVKKEQKSILSSSTSSSLANANRRSLSILASGGGTGGGGDDKENEVNGSANTSVNLSMSTSSRLAAVHGNRLSLSMVGISGIAGIVNEGGDEEMKENVKVDGTCMKGVTAFVDVWTADGADSSSIFVDMLKNLGARVLTRPTESCTHIIYKSGRPSTLSWYRKQEEPRASIVGISWVTRSKEAGKKLDENKFLVDIEDEDVFAKRRKSMEPKLYTASLSASTNGNNCMSISPSPDWRNEGNSGLTISIAFLHPGVSEAKRKISIHAPKIGSPLKQGHRGDYFGNE